MAFEARLLHSNLLRIGLIAVFMAQGFGSLIRLCGNLAFVRWPLMFNRKLRRFVSLSGGSLFHMPASLWSLTLRRELEACLPSPTTLQLERIQRVGFRVLLAQSRVTYAHVPLMPRPCFNTVSSVMYVRQGWWCKCRKKKATRSTKTRAFILLLSLAIFRFVFSVNQDHHFYD